MREPTIRPGSLFRDKNVLVRLNATLKFAYRLPFAETVTAISRSRQRNPRERSNAAGSLEKKHDIDGRVGLVSPMQLRWA